MSVLVFVDQHDGHIKKSALEAAAYGARLAAQTGTKASAVVLGPSEADSLKALGRYGIQRVLHAGEPLLGHFEATVFARVTAEAAEQENASIIVLPHNFNGRAMAPLLSVRLQAGLVTGALALPETDTGFVVKKSVFSGKAYAHVSILTDKKIITLTPNVFALEAASGEAEVIDWAPTVAEADFRVRVEATETLSGEVPLTEAEIIVSGGRGLKGPEHWGMVEDLAKALGAATACSRPVADAGWRPHHEHVGQTGITVRPNLYIAIAISGAIQHLAGVNGSKNIVVINKDPEAPFFKAATYGVVGDAFEVVPALTEAVRTYRESHS